MVGNLLCLDIELVVCLGGWGVYVLYYVIWSYEFDYGLELGYGYVVMVEVFE